MDQIKYVFFYFVFWKRLGEGLALESKSLEVK